MTLIKSFSPSAAQTRHRSSLHSLRRGAAYFLLARVSGTLPCYPSTRNTKQFNKQTVAVISCDTRYCEYHPSRDAAKRHYAALAKAFRPLVEALDFSTDSKLPFTFKNRHRMYIYVSTSLNLEEIMNLRAVLPLIVTPVVQFLPITPRYIKSLLGI